MERAPAGLVGLLDPVETDDLASRREIGPGDEAHQRLDRRIGMLDHVAQCLHDLDQVVGGDVGGHADGDAGGAVDDQVGDSGLEVRSAQVSRES